jgi:hypothetical protein
MRSPGSILQGLGATQPKTFQPLVATLAADPETAAQFGDIRLFVLG